MRSLLQRFHLGTQQDRQWHGWHLGPCREWEEVSHKLTGSSLITQHVHVQKGYSMSLLLTSRAYLWTTSRVLLTRVAHQESKLLIWLQLSARLVNKDKDLVATTDAHHRPVPVHAQRPGSCTVTTRMTSALKRVGSDESHFNVSVGNDGQSHRTVSTNHNLFEEKGEPKRYRTEVLPLTSLTSYR